MAKFFRRSRARAFQALFEAEFGRRAAANVIQRDQERRPLPDEEHRFAEGVVRGVLANRDDLDRIIRDMAPAYPLTQMAPVDRTVLRIALFELLFNNAAVPESAVINEAVELAKRYGSDGSRRLVNGVLGTVSRMRLAAPAGETEAPHGSL